MPQVGVDSQPHRSLTQVHVLPQSNTPLSNFKNMSLRIKTNISLNTDLVLLTLGLLQYTLGHTEDDFSHRNC
jgi:hypothetical protein